MSPELRAAVEALYVAFERPRPETIDGCPCCMTPDDLRALVGVPLRQVGGRVAYLYSVNALYTVGDNDDFRYFWPRLVELCLTPLHAEYRLDEFYVFSRPHYARWRETWTPEEQAATERVAAAIAEDLAHRGLPSEDSFADALIDLGYEVNRWVCALAQSLEDVTAYLRPLVAQTPALALLAFWEYQNPSSQEGPLINAFWGKAATKPARMVQWLQEPEVAAALADAYDAFGLSLYPSGAVPRSESPAPEPRR